MRPEAVIIMAAGRGLRLRPLTIDVPKALVVCRGFPLIEYACEFARHVLDGTGNIAVVTGYGGDMVKEYLEVEVKDAIVLHNEKFEKGNILSLQKGLSFRPKSFLLMNVDHIYPFAFAKRLLEASGAVVAAIDTDRSLGADDMKVKLGGNGKVQKISKALDDYDCGYIGMTLVREEGLQLYMQALDHVLAVKGEMACAEEVLQAIADMGGEVSVCDLSGLCWLEVDTIEDLIRAEEVLVEKDVLNLRFEFEHA
jgi:choline kinase